MYPSADESVSSESDAGKDELGSGSARIVNKSDEGASSSGAGSMGKMCERSVMSWVRREWASWRTDRQMDLRSEPGQRVS
mgnify:CR=1 FL=1